MKYTFTLLITLLLSVAMYAYPKQPTVTVSTVGNNAITVMIDGKQYRASSNYVTINDLAAGYHVIKIYQQTNGRRNNRVQNPQMIYNNRLLVKPRYDVDIIVSRFGKVFIDEQLNNDDDNRWSNDNSNWNDRDNNWNNNNDWNNNNNDRYSNYQPINNRDFEQLKQTIKSEAFNDTKQSVAKQMITNNYFSSAQVKEIVQLFNFENSKLDIAKYAYKYTVDKNNYYNLLDAFAFNSSKNELLQYIQDNK